MTRPRQPIRILCVCLGNICRSPTAEAALRSVLPRAQIDSAGTAGWHVGKPPYGPMQAAARSAGLEIGGMRARQITRADFDRFDLILAMDSENLRDLEPLAPAGGARLTEYLEPLGGGDVPDPYFTRDFAGALALIQRAAGAWSETLA